MRNKCTLQTFYIYFHILIKTVNNHNHNRCLVVVFCYHISFNDVSCVERDDHFSKIVVHINGT